MRINLKFFFSFLFTLLNIDFASSQDDPLIYFGGSISPDLTTENTNAWANKQTTRFSKTLDMGPCTCDLTSHCDYRCCCDNDCNEDIVKEWKKEGSCLNKNKNRMEEFKCDSRKQSFYYNKNEAGMSVKDHIFNIMCIERDNSKDLGEFYLDEFNTTQVEEDKNKWLKNFFYSRNADEDETLQYGKIVEDFTRMYRADSNGYCVETKVYYLKPFESSCIFRNGFTNNDIQTGFTQEGSAYGNGNIAGITYKFEYEILSNSQITIRTTTYKIMTMNNNNNMVKFKVIWVNSNYEENILPLTYGYLQGKPIKIATYQNDNYIYYSNGFFIPSSDRTGQCVRDINDSIEPQAILFKNNLMISCLNTGSIGRPYLYRILCDDTEHPLKIALAANSSLTDINNNNKWITLDNSQCNPDSNEIKLIILTTKEGKENEPYEYIKYAKLFFETNEENTGVFSFKVKFIDFSFKSIENSKNRKITSLDIFSDEIIEYLTDKSKS